MAKRKGKQPDAETVRLIQYAADRMFINAHERVQSAASGKVVFEFMWEDGRIVRMRHGQDDTVLEPPEDWKPGDA